MKKTLLSLLSAAFLSISHASELPGYDFHYSSAGDTAVRPVQIFDDGSRLYLQFRDPDLIPALFVNTENGVMRLPVHQDFPYIVVDRLSPEILVKVGEQQALVHYDGGRPLTDNGSMTGSSRPLTVAASASIPPERDTGLSTPFARSENKDQFAGELIFNQAPVVPLTEPRSAATTRYLPANSPISALIPAAIKKSDSHIVSAGESISLIAQKYHVSVRQIILLNNLHNANLIYAGQKLVLPAEIKTETRMIETAARSIRRQDSGYKKITEPAGRNMPANHSCDRTQFRLYEKTANGDVVVRKIRSLAEIGAMAKLYHAVYLRGTEADIDTRRGALAKYGISPSRIHVIKRSYDGGSDNGIVDIVFSDKD